VGQASLCPMSPKESPGSRIFPSRGSRIAAATTPAGAVPFVGVAPAVGEWPPRPFLIAVTPKVADRLTSRFATRRIAVRPVGASSPRTSPTWPCPRAITPSGCNRPPCDWWSRTVFLIAWPVGTSGATTASSSLGPPSRIGSRPRGKKSRAVIDTDYLERALAHFSGYLAVDELYDGPFCILSLVDNRAFICLSFRVLEHDPTQDDIRRFLAKFKARLDARGLAVRGVTTDGSELSPQPLHKLWPDVPHQVCEFHVLKEITTAVLHALATTRKELRDRIPKQPRGRPRKAERAPSRKAARQQKQVSELFEPRHLFVRHWLTADQKKTLQRITRGLAHLRRLRQIMDEVYRLFDRRCRTETALARLAQLRQRVSRFKRLGRALNKLSSPNLEKALTVLDDKLLPATSNAVERSNRRYRKAQRSIDSVRTAAHIGQRIALDMQRDQQAPDRAQTTKALHQARSGTQELQQ
jgi:hypothetical protein